MAERRVAFLGSFGSKPVETSCFFNFSLVFRALLSDCALAVPIPSQQKASKTDQNSVLDVEIGVEKANTIK
jgi:hypothetical protein